MNGGLSNARPDAPAGRTVRILSHGPRWRPHPFLARTGTHTLTRVSLFAMLLTLLAIAGPARAADNPRVLDVWPGKAPGETGPVAEEKATSKDGKVTSLTNVSRPTLSVYRPAKDKDTGACVLVCPGGGYNNLAWDHEGEQVAAWLNSIGVTGVVLKYRVPRRDGTKTGTPPPQALMDAQRALSLIRGK